MVLAVKARSSSLCRYLSSCAGANSAISALPSAVQYAGRKLPICSTNWNMPVPDVLATTRQLAPERMAKWLHSPEASASFSSTGIYYCDEPHLVQCASAQHE